LAGGRVLPGTGVDGFGATVQSRKAKASVAKVIEKAMMEKGN
jgi:hypothetical protein